MVLTDQQLLENADALPVHAAEVASELTKQIGGQVDLNGKVVVNNITKSSRSLPNIAGSSSTWSISLVRWYSSPLWFSSCSPERYIFSSKVFGWK